VARTLPDTFGARRPRPAGDTGTPRRAPLDAARLREDFPALAQELHGRPLVYLDNAATTHKPRAVLDALRRHYERDNANVRRGVHALAARATEAYERARGAVRAFLGAGGAREIVFTRGTTEAINLVAASFGRARLCPGDEVLVTEMEHHANIVPWQLACAQTGATLRVAPVDDRGELILDALADLLNERTRLVGIVHLSNALGTVNPVREVARLAHRHGAVVLVDGAQAVAHLAVDVRELDCDFYAFSGHKLYGPTGIGALYGRAALLDAMPPWQGGGEMVRSVTWEGTTYDEPPYRFEAGTPPIAGAIGLAAAIDYLGRLDPEARAAHERDLLRYSEDALGAVPGLRLVGTARHKLGGHSFVLAGAHAHDVGTILDRRGVAVRAGHHCAQPTMRRFGVPATVRASFALYNTRGDVDRLVEGLHAARRILG
jgi:cysteine desulfurase/selenocysteine lyase